MSVAAVAMAGCPSVEALLGGGDAIESHIDVCASCRAALSTAVRGCAGEARLGRYVLGTVIGAGGMGVVYRARDPQLGRVVAVKVLLGSGDSERLLREARNLARVAHPNVCHVYDAGVEGDEVWIAMELIDGVTLREWCAGEGRGVAEIVGVLVAAGRGLAAAHAVGLVHRDVKPENVLVARDGRAVVTDFGLARVEVGAATTIEMEEVEPAAGGAGAPGAVTRSGVIAGTPAYMAPEQLTGAAVDARADQFAWAVMAWELIEGARPFPVEPAARVAAVRAGIAAKRGDAMGEVLVKALREAPRDRWRDMEEMIAAVVAVKGPKAGSGKKMMMIVGGAVVAAAIAIAAVASGTGGGSATTTSTFTPPLRSTSTGSPPSTSTSTSTSASTVNAVVAPAKVAPVKVVKVAKVARPVDALFGAVDLGKAEGTMAMECSFPMDPANVDGLRGPVLDWGRVVRWEEVVVGVGGREMKKLLYEVKGARRSYVIDGRGHDQTLGSLDAVVGEVVVICPGDDVDIYRLPAGWGGAVNAVLAYARVAHAPRMPARQVRDIKAASGRVMVWAAPKAKIDGGWEMGGWSVPEGAKGAGAMAVDRDVWVVADVEGGVITVIEVRESLF